MTVEPALQAAFFFVTLLLGGLMGLLADAVSFLVRLSDAPAPPVWLRPCYEKKLPILRHPLGLPAAPAKKRCVSRLLQAIFELLLPIFAAILVAIAVFVYCDGVLRPLGILLGLCGFFLWKKLPSKAVTAIFDVISFVLRLLSCYCKALIRLPFALLARALLLILHPLARCFQAFLLRRRAAYTKKACAAELALAKRGFDFVKTSI